MIPRAILERKVINHMSRQGLRFRDGSVEEGVLRFVGNSFTYVVKVLDETDSKPELISAALESAFWAAKGERPYILAPKSMASMDELMAIRLHGIGLLLYGSHEIEELPPIVKSTKDSKKEDECKVSVEHESILQVLERIERLEKLIHKINEVDALASRLEKLEVLYGSLSGKLLVFEDTRSLHIKTAVPDMPSSKLSSEIELPSFMKDNPWLDILAGKS